ncbi:Cyclic di-GMP phosphodiesterase response regulator RpfG [Sporomusa ovata DSM 2662]|uniref:FOG: GGDEF domain n=1 Tax=Sporomusa ovata TaxID=2378 RepID=A0A0U1KTN0_9FIRM|nr:HD domain-containing phosphohydrolase [Sporomusa ovata]EQB26694.1 HD-GYP domain-containing protein [Sporomusa ovata DSM 2662]CQR70788.1 FOG: GGDEF domain [Sporomusa ovata]
MFPKYDKTLDIISSTFKKVRIFDEVPIAEWKELADNYIELTIDIEGVLDILYRIQTHHEYTFTHSLHVAILTGLLGKWTGFTGRMLKNFILSGLLHDIGKVFVPREILDMPGSLTTEESDIIQLHSEQGYQLLSTCYDVSQEVKLGVLQHHEREDGSGYPFGLKEKDLNICAKFVAIADIYDAMTSDRTYRKKIPPIIAIKIMLNQMYGKLDSVTCLTLSAKLQKHLIGTNTAGGINYESTRISKQNN